MLCGVLPTLKSISQYSRVPWYFGWKSLRYSNILPLWKAREAMINVILSGFFNSATRNITSKKVKLGIMKDKSVFSCSLPYLLLRFANCIAIWPTTWHKISFMVCLDLCNKRWLSEIEMRNGTWTISGANVAMEKEPLGTAKQITCQRKCVKQRINIEWGPTGVTVSSLFMFLICRNDIDRETSCKYGKFTETQYWREYEIPDIYWGYRRWILDLLCRIIVPTHGKLTDGSKWGWIKKERN